MKNKLIFILWLLMFSFFSCDFGIKENEETNSKEYFTVKGRCSIQGAIPSDLFPEKSIKQNAQRTVVPKIETDEITVSFESETGETKSAEVVDKDGVLNFEIELPPGKWTVKAQGKKSDDVIIESESCQIELPAENKSETVKLVLKPTQSDTKEGTFNFSFGTNYNKVSGMKYTYKKHGATESQSATIVNFSDPINIELSSGVYTFRFDFYSDTDCIDELLYSFTEVVNIFDGLTTDTWIGAGEYIKEGEICITDNMISQFISTTVYVSENGDDSNLGTFFEPVKTIQNAVDKVIAMNVGTASSEENPYKILLLSDIYTPSNDSFGSNKALVNIDPSSVSSNGNPLYLKISKCGDGNATINANRSLSDTGRVMYIGENANVTLQNLILTGGYLADNNEQCDGAGLYIKNNATVKIKNCEISGNHAKDGGGLYLCPNANDNGGNLLELSNCTISGNTATSSGGGILFCPTHNSNDDMITTLNLTNCTISSNTATQKGGGIYSYGKNPKVIMKDGSISGNTCISTGSSYGGGVYVSDGTFSMEGCTISGNTAGSETSVQNAYGGGIYGAIGTIISMKDTTIFGNKVASENDVDGAGVYLSGAELTMQENSKISGNSCVFGEHASSYGGGVYINNSSKFTMTCGEISENSAKYGGGVYVSGGKFIMNGGSISNNTVTENGKGKGVYVVKSNDIDPLFEISGDASITEDNDVYLANGTTITVTGNLTSTDTVATITPSEYITGQQVLEAGNGVIFTDKIVNRFLVTQQNGNEWYVTVNGKLQEMEKDANGYLGRAPTDLETTSEEETTEDGSVVNLTRVSCSIESYDNMLWIAHELKTSTIHKFGIKLTNDIEIPSGKWISPLDVTNASTIDGQGHSIIFNGGSGLFDRFHGGSIENLVLEGTINTRSDKNHFSGQCGVGVLAGSTYRTTIKNVVSTVNVVDTGNGYVGGLIGYFGGNSDMNENQPGSFIQNCVVYANITSTNGTVGGLVGGTWSGIRCWQINNCIYAGTVTVTEGTDKVVGAIIGTHHTGRTSTFKDTWYCANGTSKIVGKYDNEENGENFNGYVGTVISKTPADIASEAAATLLNTNSDGTTNDVWKFIPGSAYPTLKAFSSE